LIYENSFVADHISYLEVVHLNVFWTINFTRISIFLLDFFLKLFFYNLLVANWNYHLVIERGLLWLKSLHLYGYDVSGTFVNVFEKFFLNLFFIVLIIFFKVFFCQLLSTHWAIFVLDDPWVNAVLVKVMSTNSFSAVVLDLYFSKANCARNYIINDVFFLFYLVKAFRRDIQIYQLQILLFISCLL